MAAALADDTRLNTWPAAISQTDVVAGTAALKSVYGPHFIE